MGTLLKLLAAITNLTRAGGLRNIEQVYKIAKRELGDKFNVAKKQIDDAFKQGKEQKKLDDRTKDIKKIDEQGIKSLETEESQLMKRLEDKVKNLANVENISTGLTRTIAREILEKKGIQIPKGTDAIELFKQKFGQDVLLDINDLAEELVDIDRVGGRPKPLTQLIEQEGFFDVKMPNEPPQGFTPDELADIQKEIEQEDMLLKFDPTGRKLNSMGGINRIGFADGPKDPKKKALINTIKKIPKVGKIVGGVVEIINYVKTLDPIEAMKEVNKVLARKGPYKNITDKDSQKIFDDTQDHIFEREPKPSEFDVDFEDGDTNLSQGMIDLDELNFTKDASAAKKAVDNLEIKEGVADVLSDTSPAGLAKSIEIDNLMLKYPGMTKDLADQIASSSPIMKADIIAMVEQTFKMDEMGMSADEIIDTFKNTKRTKQGMGTGPEGLSEITDLYEKIRINNVQKQKDKEDNKQMRFRKLLASNKFPELNTFLEAELNEDDEKVELDVRTNFAVGSSPFTPGQVAQRKNQSYVDYLARQGVGQSGTTTGPAPNFNPFTGTSTSTPASGSSQPGTGGGGGTTNTGTGNTGGGSTGGGSTGGGSSGGGYSGGSTGGGSTGSSGGGTSGGGSNLYTGANNRPPSMGSNTGGFTGNSGILLDEPLSGQAAINSYKQYLSTVDRDKEAYKPFNTWRQDTKFSGDNLLFDMTTEKGQNEYYAAQKFLGSDLSWDDPALKPGRQLADDYVSFAQKNKGKDTMMGYSDWAKANNRRTDVSMDRETADKILAVDSSVNFSSVNDAVDTGDLGTEAANDAANAAATGTDQSATADDGFEDQSKDFGADANDGFEDQSKDYFGDIYSEGRIKNFDGVDRRMATVDEVMNAREEYQKALISGEYKPVAQRQSTADINNFMKQKYGAPLIITSKENITNHSRLQDLQAPRSDGKYADQVNARNPQPIDIGGGLKKLGGKIYNVAGQVVDTAGKILDSKPGQLALALSGVGLGGKALQTVSNIKTAVDTVNKGRDIVGQVKDVYNQSIDDTLNNAQGITGNIDLREENKTGGRVNKAVGGSLDLAARQKQSQLDFLARQPGAKPPANQPLGAQPPQPPSTSTFNPQPPATQPSGMTSGAATTMGSSMGGLTGPGVTQPAVNPKPPSNRTFDMNRIMNFDNYQMDAFRANLSQEEKALLENQLQSQGPMGFAHGDSTYDEMFGITAKKRAPGKKYDVEYWDGDDISDEDYYDFYDNLKPSEQREYNRQVDIVDGYDPKDLMGEMKYGGLHDDFSLSRFGIDEADFYDNMTVEEQYDLEHVADYIDNEMNYGGLYNAAEALEKKGIDPKQFIGSDGMYDRIALTKTYVDSELKDLTDNGFITEKDIELFDGQGFYGKQQLLRKGQNAYYDSLRSRSYNSYSPQNPGNLTPRKTIEVQMQDLINKQGGMGTGRGNSINQSTSGYMKGGRVKLKYGSDAYGQSKKVKSSMNVDYNDPFQKLMGNDSSRFIKSTSSLAKYAKNLNELKNSKQAKDALRKSLLVQNEKTREDALKRLTLLKKLYSGGKSV